MRIVVANIAAAAPGNHEGDFVRSVLGPMTIRNLALAAPPGTEFVMRWSEAGFTDPIFADCRYLRRLAPDHITGALTTMPPGSVDGAIVACFGDPSLADVRSRLSIPVAGFGEPALKAAAASGLRVGIVAPAAVLVEPFRHQAIAAGIDPARLEVMASSEPAAEQELGLIDASGTIEAFFHDARQLIARGAELLIPGCGLQSTALRLAPGLEAQFPHGVTAVDGRPVLDVLTLSMQSLMAQLAAGPNTRRPPLDPAPGPVGNYWNCGSGV